VIRCIAARRAGESLTITPPLAEFLELRHGMLPSGQQPPP